MELVTTRPGLPLARTAPMRARLSASVPLAVKMIASGSAPIKRAYPAPAELPTQEGPNGMRYDFNDGCPR